LAGLLASIACGVIGTLVVVNRIVFLAGGIAHAAYGGVGLALFLGWPLTLGAALFSITASAAMGFASAGRKHRADTLIGVMWAAGFAVGIVFADLTPGYNVDLMSYLFGSILAVPTSDLWLMCGLNAIILSSVCWFYKELSAVSYDEEFATVRGVPSRMLHYLLMMMVALCVIMIIRLVGLVLVMALLTISPYIAEGFSKSLSSMMAWSAAFSAAFILIGLWLSFHLNLASGATIILVAAAAFFLDFARRSLLLRREEAVSE
jgi:zinc transport system permease protein